VCIRPVKSSCSPSASAAATAAAAGGKLLLEGNAVDGLCHIAVNETPS